MTLYEKVINFMIGALIGLGIACLIRLLGGMFYEPEKVAQPAKTGMA